MVKLTRKQISTLTRKIIGKDNLKCAICGKKENGIHIHHKDRERQNNQITNLIPLCNKCHISLHYKEDFRYCKKCGRITKEGKSHKCPSQEEYYIISVRNVKKRERCERCGKLLGKDKTKHSCEHPRGMLGKKHTEKTKKHLSKKLSKIKKEWWKMKKLSLTK